MFNHVEAVFWMGLGLLCAYQGVRGRGRVRRLALIAAPVLVVFGCSDIVEARTGAWWQPWWLLVWKATCVAVLVVLGILLIRARSTRG